MAWVPYALMAAAAVYKGVSGKQTAEDNQQIAKQMARREGAIGALKAEQIRRQGRALASKQIAHFGTSGVDLSGTPTDLIAQDATQVELDALNANYDAMSRRNAYLTQASQFQQQGNQELFGSLLTAGSSIGSGVAAARGAPQAPSIMAGGGGGSGSAGGWGPHT